MSEELKRIEAVLDEKVRPSLRAHGGELEIDHLEEGVLYIKLLGQCAGCPSADLTNETLIEHELTAALPELVRKVVVVQTVSDELWEQAKRLLEDRRRRIKRAKDAGQLDKETRGARQREINVLEDYRARLGREGIPAEGAMDAVRDWFGQEVERRKTMAVETKAMFDNAFRFLETTFGQGQELVIFVTEITAGYDTSWFVEQFGCDAYFRHNRELLFDSTRHRIREEIAQAVDRS